MTDWQAKEILVLYRPGSAHANDPAFAEALACLQQSPELKEWFENHCAVQEAIRAKFKQIVVPEGLREQIISERKARMARHQRRRNAVLAGVAVLAVVGTIVTIWLRQEAALAREHSLAVFESRMISTVQRAYTMDLETNNLAVIRTYLASRQAIADWELPTRLEQTTCTGCGVLPWHEKPVSMICFSSDRLPGQKTDMFLFVVNSNDVRNAPAEGATEVAQVNRMFTASWTASGKTYVLAVEGDETFLRSLL